MTRPRPRRLTPVPASATEIPTPTRKEILTGCLAALAVLGVGLALTLLTVWAVVTVVKWAWTS